MWSCSVRACFLDRGGGDGRRAHIRESGGQYGRIRARAVAMYSRDGEYWAQDKAVSRCKSGQTEGKTQGGRKEGIDTHLSSAVFARWTRFFVQSPAARMGGLDDVAEEDPAWADAILVLGSGHYLSRKAKRVSGVSLSLHALRIPWPPYFSPFTRLFIGSLCERLHSACRAHPL